MQDLATPRTAAPHNGFGHHSTLVEFVPARAKQGRPRVAIAGRNDGNHHHLTVAVHCSIRAISFFCNGPEAACNRAGSTRFSVGELCRAQTRGDAAAMLTEGRRLLRLDFGVNAIDGLRALANALADTTAAAR